MGEERLMMLTMPIFWSRRKTEASGFSSLPEFPSEKFSSRHSFRTTTQSRRVVLRLIEKVDDDDRPTSSRKTPPQTRYLALIGQFSNLLNPTPIAAQQQVRHANFAWSDSLLLFQLERGRIHAIPLTSWGRTIIEHMAEMSAAGAAHHFDPAHAVTEVDLFFHIFF